MLRTEADGDVDEARPAVSVVVAVRNDRDGLDETLRALHHQDTCTRGLEIVVVDDGSCDGTAAVARRYPDVQVILLPSSHGSYFARNRGLEAARGRIIAITDADCRPRPDWIRRGAAVLDRDETRIVGGHIVMPLGEHPSLASMVDAMVHLDQERYVKEQGTAVTANLFASAATFRSVGGFDERLRSSGDFEWTRRAVRAGHELVFARDVVVEHPPRTTASSLVRKARRVGTGARMAAHEGLSSFRPLYLSPRCLVPAGRARSRARLQEHGADPRGLTWLVLGILQVFLLQIPQAWAQLTEDLRWWKDRLIRR